MIMSYSQLCQLYYVQFCCTRNEVLFEIVPLIFLLYAYMNADSEENKFKIKLKHVIFSRIFSNTDTVFN